MKKRLLSRLSFALIFSGILFSCGKKSDPASPASASYTVNGANYAATNQILISSASVLTDTTSNFDPPISADGSFLAYTQNQQANNITVYGFIFEQSNIVAKGDTTSLGIIFESRSSVATGTYAIVGADEESTPGTTKVVVLYERTNQFDGVKGSASGTLVISAIDAVKHTLSATYNFTTIDSSGTKPITAVITNGKINNINYQPF